MLALSAGDRRAGLAALQELGDRAWRLWRDRAREAAGRGSSIARARFAFDESLRTDEVEELDRDDLRAERRVAIIEDIFFLTRFARRARAWRPGHARFNDVLRSNQRFTRLLEPLVRAAAGRGAAPVRILEIASGHGELAFHIAAWAAGRGIPVEVTASDVADVYVDLGNRKAAERGLPVRFRKLDAFDLDLDDGSQDVLLMAQTLHHFPFGGLVRAIAEATRAGRSALFVDGWRSLALLAGLAAFLRVFFPDTLFHDGVISARKFYSADELRLAAGLVPAAPRASVRFVPPGHAVLRFDPE